VLYILPMKNVVLFLFLGCLSCGEFKSQQTQVPLEKPRKEDTTENSKEELNVMEYASPTIYYIPSYTYQESQNCSENLKKNFLDENGKLLARVCGEIYKSCEMQGTCRIGFSKQSAQLINVVGKKSGVQRFKVVTDNQCRYGFGRSSDGVHSYKKMCLNPFYTLAADLKYYKLGDVLFFPDLKNVKLPNGRIHDGYMIVRDSGGGIKGEGRFDFFSGYFHYFNSENPFAKLQLHTKTKKIKYFIITDEEEIKFVQSEHQFPFVHY
jgi:3D (Asp-Asp-Asp) domain-containing protein